MTSITKWIIGAIAIIVIATLVWSAKNESKPGTQNKGQFKIGSMIPLSGEFAALGEEIKRGADIAIAEAKEKGIQVDYVSEDDGLLPTKEASAAQKLTQFDKVDAAFTSTVQEIKVVDKTFNAAKVPLLTAWDSNDYIKNAGDYIYSIGFSTEAAGEVMASHAAQKLNLKKVAVIYIDDEWSALIASSFTKKYQELGGEVVMNEKILPSVKDFRSLIAKAKSVGADGIYFPLFPSYCGAFMKQARELGYQGALMTADSMTDNDVAIAGSAAEGAYVSMLFAENAPRLLESYQKMYGAAPSMPIFAAIGYDAVNTLLEAHRIADAQHVALDKALTMVKITGAVGDIDMAGKHYHERIERINVVKNGKIVELK